MKTILLVDNAGSPFPTFEIDVDITDSIQDVVAPASYDKLVTIMDIRGISDEAIKKGLNFTLETFNWRDIVAMIQQAVTVSATMIDTQGKSNPESVEFWP